MEQLKVVLDEGISSVIADFQDIRLYADAVRVTHAAGATIQLATPRIHKPGESEVFALLADSQPDGVLARNLAGLAFFHRAELPTVADFSFNVVNDLAISWLRTQGAQRVTAAYDLGDRQLLDLAAAVPPEWLEVIVHRHAPMFHLQYCVFSGTFSQGKNSRDCGRPCRRHKVRLRDRKGVNHSLLVDGQCHGTLYHAEAESLSRITPVLYERGIRHFRVELLEENRLEDVRRVLAPYRRFCES